MTIQNRAGIIVICAMLLPAHSAYSEESDQALRARDKAMQELAADSKRILADLDSLSQKQKNSVIALMAISRAAAAYEAPLLKKSAPSLREYYGNFRDFSKAYRAPGTFQVHLSSCFDETIACASAQARCKGTDRECDRDPSVAAACSREAICMVKAFQELHRGIPDILGGRDPWPPPQPFPYF